MIWKFRHFNVALLCYRGKQNTRSVVLSIYTQSKTCFHGLPYKPYCLPNQAISLLRSCLANLKSTQLDSNISVNLTSELIPFSVPVPAPLPRLSARRRHRDDGQERGDCLGAKPPQVEVPRDGRGGRATGGRSPGMYGSQYEIFTCMQSRWWHKLVRGWACVQNQQQTAEIRIPY